MLLDFSPAPIHLTLEKCFVFIMCRNYVDNEKTVWRLKLFWRFYVEIKVEFLDIMEKTHFFKCKA